ncbi:DgyrCDS11396 [Dimorphilus gyrociliatus]|uniref:DgyrCDS11396 n=1 Tax=Dimorphilus gyrociliatus TaxID=2664684 RepID=A0A7I8W484_9ANNE|nr:DgyrCDS11396 [Dimorphilus gyrociliatus]
MIFGKLLFFLTYIISFIVYSHQQVTTDISISNVLETSSLPLKQSIATSLDLQFSIDNTGLNVPAATTPDIIYTFYVRYENVGENLGLSEILLTGVTPSQSDAHNTGLTKLFSVSSISLTIPAASCLVITKLCVRVSPNVAHITDANAANDLSCLDIESRKSCAPDPSLTTFTSLTSSSISTNYLKRDTAGTITLSVTVQNSAASGSGNDITAVTGASQNFEFQCTLAEVDLKSNAGTSSYSSPSGITMDVQQALNAGASVSSDMTISYTLTSANCASTHFICVKLSIPSTASYNDINTADSSNVICTSIDTLKVCTPLLGLSITSLVSQATPPIYKANVATTTNVLVSIGNTAANTPSGHGNDIPLADSGGINYLLTARFRNSADNLGLASQTVTLNTPSHAERALSASGSSENFDGTVVVTLPTANCGDITYLCIKVETGTGATYVATAVEQCSDITAIKSCPTNVEVTVLAISGGGTYLKKDTTTSYSTTSTISNTGSNILVNPSQDNFIIEYQLSNVDVRSTGLASNTLGHTAVTATVTPVSDLRTGLLNAGTFAFTCQGSVQNPVGKCIETRWLCIHIYPAGTATYEDTDNTDDWRCISLSRTCDTDPTINLPLTISPTNTYAIQDSANLIGISTVVANSATFTVGNNIIAVTGSDANFAFEVSLSNVDLRTTAGTESWQTVSGISSGTLQQGLNGQATFSLTASYSLTLTSATCSSSKFFCLKLIVPATSSYLDIDSAASSNIACSDLNAHKVCDPQLSLAITSIDPQSTPKTYKAGISQTIDYDVVLSNTGSTTPADHGNDIPAAVGASDVNWLLKTRYTDSDTADTLALSEQTVTLTTSSVGRSGLAAGGTLNLVGSATITLPSAQCSSIKFLCISISPGSMATHTEPTVSKCKDIEADKICSPDPSLTALASLTSASINSKRLMRNTAGVVTLSVTVQNSAASGSGNDITAVTGASQNFEFQCSLAEVDLKSNAGTSSYSSPSGITMDVQQALNAGASVSSDMTISYTLTSANCASTHFICVKLSIPSTASYNDINTADSSNVICTSIDTLKVCTPLLGLSISSLVSQATPPIYKANVATTTNVLVSIGNTAANTPSGHGNDIPLADSGGINYLLTTRFRNSADNLGLASQTVTLNTPSHAERALSASGSSENFDGTVVVTLPTANCGDITFLCIKVETGSGATYVATAVEQCSDITAIKSCPTNVEVTVFTDSSSPTYLKKDTSTSYSTTATISNTGSNILVNPSQDNFIIEYQLSNVDVRSTGLASNTLGHTAVTATVTPVSDLRTGLLNAGTFVFTCQASVQNPVGKCIETRWLCVHIYPAGTATYEDTDNTDDWRCISLSRTCDTDPTINLPLTISPTNTYAIQDSANLIGISTVVANSATFTVGNNIIAVTGSDANFAFEVSLSNVDLRTTAGTESWQTVSGISSGTLQQGLNGQATFSLTASYSLTLTSATCSSSKFFCLKLIVPATSSYLDIDSAASSNIACSDLNAHKVCDPQLSLAITSIDPQSTPKTYKAGISQTIDYDVVLSNTGSTTPADHGNDIPAAVGASDVNWLLKTRYTDSDTADTLALSEQTVTLTTSSVGRSGLAAGGTLNLVGSATITLPSAQCSSIKFLCISISPGSMATHTEPTVSKCKDIEADKICSPDPSLTVLASLTSTSINTKRLMRNTAGVVTLSVTVQNSAASGSGNDITAVTGASQNFDFQCTLAEVDLKSNTGTSSYSSPSGITMDVQQALNAGASVSSDMTISYTLTSANCASTHFICVKLSIPSTASYNDINTADSSNVICTSIDTLKVCTPLLGLSITSLVSQATPPIYKANVATTTNVLVSIGNTAANTPSGHGNDIPLADSGGINYLLTTRFRNSADNLGLASQTVTLNTPSHAERALSASGSSENFDGTVVVTLPTANCGDITFLCIKVETGSGATYVATAVEQCSDISAIKSCPTNVEVTVFTDSSSPTYLKKDTSTSYSTTATISNTGSNILVNPSQDNFVIEYQLSNVDIRSTGVASNTLGHTAVTATVTPVSDLRTGLLNAGTFVFTCQASVQNPVGKCLDSRWLCIHIYSAGTATYEDTDNTDDWRCILLSRTCDTDPTINLPLTISPTNTYAIQDSANLIGISTVVANSATFTVGNNIIAVTGSDANFAFEVSLSNVDLRTTAGTESWQTVSGISSGTLQQGLNGQATFSLTASYSLTLTSATCSSSKFFCLKLIVPATSSYLDIDSAASSNIACSDLNAHKVCDPQLSLAITSIDPQSTPKTYKAGISQTIDYDVILSNTGSTTPADHGNDIPAAVGASDVNWLLKTRYTDSDTADTLALSEQTVTLTTSSVGRSGLAAGGTLNLVGTATITLPSAQCSSIKFLCISISPGSMATHSEPTVSKCKDIESDKSCSPDPKVSSLSISPGGLKFNSDTDLAITIQSDIENVGTAGNDLPPNPGSTNFDAEMFFSSADVRAGGTDTLTATKYAVTVTSNKDAGIAAGATVTLDGSVTVRLGNECENAKFLCFTLKAASTATYADEDVSASSNTFCNDISSSKFCRSDLKISSLTLTSNNFIQDQANSLNIEFDLGNDGAAGIQSTTLPTVNKEIKVKASDQDLGSVGASSDTLGAVATDLSVSPASQKSAGLLSGSSVHITGTVSITISAAQCQNALWLCVSVLPPTGATYIDLDESNNWECIDISTKRTCLPDPKFAASSLTETSSQAFIIGTTKTLSFSFDITNGASAVSGNTVLAVTGVNVNFGFSALLTNADIGGGGTDTLSQTPVAVTVSLASLQQSLAPSATATVTGTATITFPSGLQCTQLTHVCITLIVGTGASYTDADTTNNVICLDITNRKTCGPDPALVSVTEAANANLDTGVAKTLSISVSIENKAAASSGNDLLSVIAPNANFILESQFSDVDIGNGGTDTLALAKSAVTITPASDALKAISQGATETIGATASVTVPSGSSCQSVTYLCFHLSVGTGASYIDADLNNNVVCKDISAQKACQPDLTITSIGITPGTFLKMNTAVTVVSNVTIQNAASGSRSNIATATAPVTNYALQYKLSRDNLETNVDTLGLSPVTATGLPVSDLRLSLASQESITVQITGDLTVPILDCKLVLYLCVRVDPGTAGYTEMLSTNNYKCESITAKRTCGPNVDIQTLTQPSSAMINEGSTTELNFQLQIVNIATAATENDVLAVISPASNYKVTVQLSNANLETGGTDTLGLTTVDLTIPDNTQTVQDLIAAGPAKTLDSIANFTVPDGKCIGLLFACATIAPEASSSYVDVDTSNNVQCIDISGQRQCRPVWSNLPASIIINEDESIERILITAAATDPIGESLTYEMSPRQPSVPFKITSDGKISIINAPNLDFEPGPRQYILNVYVSDGVFNETTTYTVNVADVNEAPNITNLPMTITPSENLKGNLFTITGVDVDSGDSITYSFTTVPATTAGQPFNINTGTGAIEVAWPPGLDYEKVTSYVMTVTATDSSGLTSIKDLTIDVVNAPDPPEINNLPASIAILENVTTSAVFFSINATDLQNDDILFNLSVTPASAQNKFFIQNGHEIAFIDNPDFNGATEPLITITVVPYDTTSLVGISQILTLNVINANDEPKIHNLPSSISIPEDFAMGTPVFTINWEDRDGDQVNWVYTVSPSNMSTAFNISNNGLIHITNNPRLDYETLQKITITISACDIAICTNNKVLAVNIKNVDEAPRFTPSSLKANLPESSPVGGYVTLKFNASDDDIGDSFAFKLSSGIHNDYFTINPTNGQLKLIKELDYENSSLPKSFIFGIIATDSTSLSSSLSVIINVTNVNEHPPVFLPSLYRATVKENSPPGVTVVQVSATDGDSDIFGRLEFSISVLNNGSTYLKAIQISNTKAVIVTSTTPYDREKTPVHSAYVYAGDGGRTYQRAHLLITILDDNDNPPVFNPSWYNMEVSWDAPVATSVKKIEVTDPDSSDTRFTYTALQPDTYFYIGALDGQVTVNGKLENDRVYILFATATDMVGHKSTNKATIRVDTYDRNLILTNWTVTTTSGTFTEEDIKEFERNISTSCTPCSAKVTKVVLTADPKKFVLLTYFLADNGTSPGDTKTPKNYLSQDKVVDQFQKNSVNQRIGEMTIESMGPYKETKKENWWTDTAGGQAVIAVICFSSLVIVTHAIAYAADVFYFKGRARYRFFKFQTNGRSPKSLSSASVAPSEQPQSSGSGATVKDVELRLNSSETATGGGPSIPAADS